ncbi:MAG: acetyltransferase [Lachnospiraceae bacterium]|nr:acetyltransferase [Lachnospiraceae bacterium]
MNKFIVIGANKFAEMLSHYVEYYNRKVCCGYSVEQEYIKSDEAFNKKLVPYEQLENLYPPDEFSVLLAIGYKNMNGLRERFYNELLSRGYEIESFIHPTVHFEIGTEIGNANIILENVNIGYRSKVGNCNIIWNGCNISHHAIIGNYNFFAASSVLAGEVHVKNNCFFGVNSAVRGATTIEDASLIGAGSYINKSTEANRVYVPGRNLCLEDKVSRDFF